MWTPTNYTSTIPSYRTEGHNNYRAHTDMWIEDGSFVRLKKYYVRIFIPQELGIKAWIGQVPFIRCSR